ncbi:MAG: oxidoreductase, partial [Spirochaetota bacterium]
GGENWDRVPPASLPPMMDGEAFFAASGTSMSTFGENGLCFTSGGSVSRVFWSEDKGSSWAVNDIPLLSGAPSQGGFSIAVLDGIHACVAGGDYAQDQVNSRTVVHTRDVGKSWALAKGFPPGGYNSCVAYVPGTDGQVLLATGTRGTHISEDSGSTWRRLIEEPFHVLGFDSTGRSGWAAGADGRVSRMELVLT